MKTKVVSSIAAALVVASFVPPAIAETLGEHPAVVVARTWNNKGIDPNTFIVAPPASTRWVSEAPKTEDKHAQANEAPKLPWSVTTGTGVPASPHWTASIGTGSAATSASAVPDTKKPSSS